MKNTLKKDIPFFFGSAAVVWQCIFFYIPLLLILLSSFFYYSEEGIIRGLTLSNFQAILQKNTFSILLSSIGIACLTSLLSIFIGYPLAHFIAFKGKRFKSLFLFLLIVPFWTNFLLHVYAWFFILENNGFLSRFLEWAHLSSGPVNLMNSLFSTVLMMVYTYLPFMVLPIYSSMEKFDRKILEASSNLGASSIQNFKKVLFPLTLPALQAGCLLVFIPSFGEFIIPELMGGDKIYFFGNVITNYMFGEDTAGIGAAFTIIGAITLFVFLFVAKHLFSAISRIKRGLS